MSARQFIDCKWAYVPGNASPEARREAWFAIVKECAEQYGVDATTAAIVGHALRRAA